MHRPSPLHSFSFLYHVLLFSGATFVNAHGDEHDTSLMDMTVITHGEQMGANRTEELGPPSYYRHGEYTSWMVGHIVVMSIAWVLILPIATMLSISKSRYSFITQLCFLLVNGLGVILAIVYNTSTPDLYEGNAHHGLGWLLSSFAVVLTGMALLDQYVKGRNIHHHDDSVAFLPISTQIMAEHQRQQRPKPDSRYSGDSGQGTERNTDSLISQSTTSNDDDGDTFRMPMRWDIEEVTELKKPGILAGSKVEAYLSRKFSDLETSRVYRLVSAIYRASVRVMLLLGFIAILTGVVTYAGVFRGNHVFSGLAHLIKGAVFFWYGVLTLGRWAGCFSDRGWAWNINPARSSKLSAEFTESFLIFFYGATNIFLEHLGSWNGEWSAQDLEHVAITFLFLCGGLCGMLIESKEVRNLLNATVLQSSLEHPPASYNFDNTDVRSWRAPASYQSSMNPIPALVILLLGLMMSSHHQESMVSTMMHGQWGTLLMGAAFARAGTYILMYLSPPISFLPGRPPTELITAFCLIAGGTIFMASSSDTVSAMEFNGVDAMFVFTIAMGMIMFLMAWIIFVIAIKGWAVRKEAGVKQNLDFPDT